MIDLQSISTKDIILYLRKSRTDDPALSVSETVAKHEQMLDDYCMRVFGEIVPEENRYREIVSGETIASRPEIQKVLRLIEQPRYKAVLIVEPQRLSRGDLEDIGRLSKILRYTSTIVITLQYAYDLSDDRDREFFERELKRGNEYLEYYKRIMQNGRRYSIEAGHYIGSVTPYGYKKTYVRIGKKNVPTLEIVPEQAEAVKLIFQMYADGAGAWSIVKRLNDAGFKPMFTEDWKEGVIFRILDNPHYIGKVRSNYRCTKTTVIDGEIVKTRKCNRSEIVFDGLHPAIIDLELWQRVRALRAYRHVPATKSTAELVNPLAGLVSCECGAAMIKSCARNNRRKSRLYCSKQKVCGNASAILDDIVDAVRESLEQEFQNEDIEVISTDAKPHIDTKVLSARLAALEKKQDALWEQLAEGMPREVFDRLIVSVTSDIERTKTELSDAEAAENSGAIVRSFRTTIQDAIAALDNPCVSVIEKNRFLKACIQRITYSRQAGKPFHLSIQYKI